MKNLVVASVYHQCVSTKPTTHVRMTVRKTATATTTAIITTTTNTTSILPAPTTSKVLVFNMKFIPARF
jgi:hypothetical protein